MNIFGKKENISGQKEHLQKNLIQTHWSINHFGLLHIACMSTNLQPCILYNERMVSCIFYSTCEFQQVGSVVKPS